jgi:hypothetical protein
MSDKLAATQVFFAVRADKRMNEVKADCRDI